MGEILAAHNGLAQEYAHILLSYAREEGNYLELEALQRGLLWGIGRLAEKTSGSGQRGRRLFAAASGVTG